MVFPPNPAKQVQEVIFPRNSNSLEYSDSNFSSLAVEKIKTQKHLRVKVDEKLNFKERFKNRCASIRKGNAMLIKKWSNYLPRQSLVTLYTTSFRLH